MPATITYTGTWTDLSSVFNAARSNMIGNEPRLEGPKGSAPGGEGINLEILKYRDGVKLDELRQFIELFAQQYGLLYWPAALAIYLLVKTEVQGHRTSTLLGDSAVENRLYIP